MNKTEERIEGIGLHDFKNSGQQTTELIVSRVFQPRNMILAGLVLGAASVLLAAQRAKRDKLDPPWTKLRLQ